MYVEDLLPRGFSIREKEIHTFAAQVRAVERRSQLLSDGKYVAAVFLTKTCQVGSMRDGNDD